MKDEKYVGALVMVDIFIKDCCAIPFKTNNQDEILQCIKDGIEKMGGKPKTFYTDNEGSFSSNIANKYYEENHIRHLVTATHAGVVERLIRTLKDNIYERQEIPKAMV